MRLRIAAIAIIVALGVGVCHAQNNLRIVIHKHERTLQLFSRDSLISSYPIALGTNPNDPKRKSGDRCTPEGSYRICEKNAKSHFYLSLGLNYPNADDAERGLRDHLISHAQYAQIVSADLHRQKPLWNTALGGEIMIHGGGTGQDWTWGCVALDNPNIKALFENVPIGTTVEILH